MNELTALERRLAALEDHARRAERTARRWRTACGTLAAVGFTLLGAAAARPPITEVLRAQRLEIVDGEGRLLLRAGGGEKGAELNLWTESGQNVVRIGGNDRGGDIALWNRDGVNVYGAFATEGGGETALWNADGARVVRAIAEPVGGRVDLHDPNDVPVWSAASGAAGARLVMQSPGGAPSWLAAAGPDGGVLEVGNAQGEPVVRAEPDPTGSGLLTVADAAGEPRFYAGITEHGSVAHFRGADGTTVASLGASSPGVSGTLQLFTASGARAISIGSEEDGCGRLDLMNDVGEAVCTIDGVAGVGATLSLSAAGGERGFAAASRPQGGLINLRNGSGQPVVVAGAVRDQPGGGLAVLNDAGAQVLQVGVDTTGGGQLVIWDAEGRRRETVLPRR